MQESARTLVYFVERKLHAVRLAQALLSCVDDESIVLLHSPL